MPYEPDPLEEHHELSRTEQRVLYRVAKGESDDEIGGGEEMTVVAVHSCLRRFRERTGLAGRLMTAWTVKHEECCISSKSQGG